jgi:hypothetical protein
MLTFHISIAARGQDQACGLRVCFGEAFSALQALDRMFIEPDGSFVWTGVAPDGQRWQLDGTLIDRGDVLAYVELKGSCPEDQFDLLLSALGWPQSPLVFQVTQRGVTLEEAAFRRLAASEMGAV